MLNTINSMCMYTYKCTYVSGMLKLVHTSLGELIVHISFQLCD